MAGWDQLSPFALPVGLGDPSRAQVVGRDELGRPVLRGVDGQTYSLPTPAPNAQPDNALRALVDSYQATQGPPDRAGEIAAAIGRLPNALAEAVWQGVSAPGRAAAGEPVTLGDAWATALDWGAMGAPIGALSRAVPAEIVDESRFVGYTLPTQSEVGHALGTPGPRGVDLEGRPLGARYVVGRAEPGAGDQSLSQEALAEVVAGLTGHYPEAVPQGALPPRAVASVVRSPADGNLQVRYLETLAPPQQRVALGHETGHVIDHVASQGRGIPPTGLRDDLVANYSFGIENRLPAAGYGSRAGAGLDLRALGFERGRSGRATVPTDNRAGGYRPDEVLGENMAEAIRQYALAPDTFRTLFPATARRIRDAVNAHPFLRDTIQFNSLTGLGALPGGAILAGMAGEPRSEAEQNALAAYLGGI